MASLNATREAIRKNEFVLLLRERGYTLGEIASRIGVTVERVRQREVRAIRRRGRFKYQFEQDLSDIQDELIAQRFRNLFRKARRTKE